MRSLPLLCHLALLALLQLPVACSHGSREREASRVRALLEQPGYGTAERFAGEQLVSRAGLDRFYRARGWGLAWHDEGHEIPAAAELRRVIADVDRDGLRREEYHCGAIGVAVVPPADPDSIAVRDLFLTDAFLTLASHFRDGRTAYGDSTAAWKRCSEDTMAVRSLAGALARGGLTDTLRSLLPRDRYYLLLKRELAHVRRGSGRNAVAGRETRIDQVLANMERCRWMPRTAPAELIRVDVATQRLEVFEEGTEVLSMKTVVGLPGWQTPIFAAAIDRIVLNPTWLSPRHILATEILGYIKADSNYLRGNVMTLLRWRGDTAQVVDPRSIDWKKMTPEAIDFAVRQEPGPGNIMGRVKFLADNPYAIFLHDTPYRGDFSRARRMASHGCIRLERAFDLAAWFFAREGRRDTVWMKRVLDSLIEQTLRLRVPVEVRVEYRTVAFDSAGRGVYLEDIYGLDRKVGRALRTSAKERPCEEVSSGGDGRRSPVDASSR